jgi:hypothetical protein
LVILNPDSLALYSSIETSATVAVLSGDDIIISTFDDSLQTFHTVLYDASYAVGDKDLLSGQSIRVVSKNIPVIHVKDEDDTIVSNLAAFQTVKSFKETWPSNSIYCYFGITEETLKVLSTLNPLTIRHYSSLLHDFWLDTENVFHVDFEKNYMHVFCKRNGHFLYYNKLFFENDVDVHYNIAIVAKEVLNSDERVDIIFSGEIHRDSRVLKTLSSYYANIRFINENGRDFILQDKVTDPLYFDKYLAMVCG